MRYRPFKLLISSSTIPDTREGAEDGGKGRQDDSLGGDEQDTGLSTLHPGDFPRYFCRSLLRGKHGCSQGRRHPSRLVAHKTQQWRHHQCHSLLIHQRRTSDQMNSLGLLFFNTPLTLYLPK